MQHCFLSRQPFPVAHEATVCIACSAVILAGNVLNLALDAPAALTVAYAAVSGAIVLIGNLACATRVWLKR